MTAISRKHRFALAAVLSIAILALVPAALAAKGGGGGGGGGGGHNKPGPTPTGSFSLVLLNSTDGLPHYGQQITFNVTSTATYYFVQLDCFQSGTRVYNNTIGFYTGWPWSQTYFLESSLWTGGAATCNALLYSSLSDGSNPQTLATMSFDVAA